MDIKCYAFENTDHELESPFYEYLQKYAPPMKESQKALEKRVNRIIKVKEHIKHLISIKGCYQYPPLVKSYKCRKIGDITEIGVLKIKEGNNLIRVGFITLIDRNEILIFDAFDKPASYEKAKKQQVKKIEHQFIERIEACIENYFENRFSLPLNLEK
ncbi:hypothetical protein QUF70_02170 [Desulfobacterales bacterium HSG17]|nr:hypothetical protein [Desulfobacterales bacterium HSG17]